MANATVRIAGTLTGEKFWRSKAHRINACQFSFMPIFLMSVEKFRVLVAHHLGECLRRTFTWTGALQHDLLSDRRLLEHGIDVGIEPRHELRIEAASDQ